MIYKINNQEVSKGVFNFVKYLKENDDTMVFTLGIKSLSYIDKEIKECISKYRNSGKRIFFIDAYGKRYAELKEWQEEVYYTKQFYYNKEITKDELFKLYQNSNKRRNPSNMISFDRWLIEKEYDEDIRITKPVTEWIKLNDDCELDTSNARETCFDKFVDKDNLDEFYKITQELGDKIMYVLSGNYGVLRIIYKDKLMELNI